MVEGKRISLNELFKRKAAEARAELARKDAYEATPEGAAEKAEREAFHKRMQDADERFAAEHPPTPRDQGAAAYSQGIECYPPKELNAEDQREWEEGWRNERDADLDADDEKDEDDEDDEDDE